MNGISVIIPVYNGGHMLKKCLGSIDGSRVEEIIVVDDGSTDDTLAVARELAERDERLRVIHTENHGVYEARRAGIAASTAAYIAFLDADDRYCRGALDALADLLEAHEADVAMGGILETDDPDAPQPRAGEAQVRVLSPEEMWPRIMKWGTQEFILYVWHKLYRRETLEGLVEAEGICQGDDVLITCQTFLKVNRTVETTRPVYRYYQNPESLTHRGFGDRDLDLIRVWDRVVDLMDGQSEQLRQMARFNRWRTDFTLMTRLILANDKALDAKYAGELKQWRHSLSIHWKSLVRILPMNRKLLVLGLRFTFGLTKRIIRTAKGLVNHR